MYTMRVIKFMNDKSHKNLKANHYTRGQRITSSTKHHQGDQLQRIQIHSSGNSLLITITINNVMVTDTNIKIGKALLKSKDINNLMVNT